jgi:hypothetical protein
MTLQYSVAVRNARLDAVESTTGTAPTLEIRSGAPPATAATADSGTLLCTLTLPSDWMANAASGVKALAGSWTGTATTGGTAGHFRIKQGATTHIQGTVTATGGGGDMTVDNTSFAADQQFTVTGFTLTAGNA